MMHHRREGRSIRPVQEAVQGLPLTVTAIPFMGGLEKRLEWVGRAVRLLSPFSLGRLLQLIRAGLARG